jgi:hypothetical protein
MSETLWWSMPGPSAFVEDVLQSLREGRTVAVWFPENGHDGFLSALQYEDERSGLTAWTRRVVDADGASPARTLHEECCPIQDDVVPTVTTFLADERASSVLPLVSATTARERELWSDFLHEYRRHAKPLEQFRRPVLCVVFAGGSQSELPASDIVLSVNHWWGRSGALDMRLFAARLLTDGRLNPMMRAIAIDVIASLAGADPLLAARLASVRFDCLLQPFDLLRDFAIRRKWPADPDETEAIRLGALASVDEERVWHSALLAAQRKNDGVARRIWRGQVAQIFPFLEDRRAELVDGCKAYLPKVPVSTEFGVINDLYELEIGELAFYLSEAKAPKSLRSRAEQLRKARNALAHLTPLTALECNRLVMAKSPHDR